MLLTIGVFFSMQRGHLLASTGDLLPLIDAGSGAVESGSGEDLNVKKIVPALSGSGSLEENLPVEVQTETGSQQSGTGSELEKIIPSEPAPSETSESSSVAMSSSSAEISSASSMVSFEGSSLSSDSSSLSSSEVSSAASSEERTVEDILSPIEATLVIDAPFAKNNPILRITKNSRIRSQADIEDSLKLTLTASGTDLPVTFTVHAEEDSPYSAHLVTISTPSVFVPGIYHLSVLWNRSREEQRLLQRMIDTFTGGQDDMLLEQDITLGSTTDNVTTPSVSDLLTLTRTGPSATSLLQTETMTLTITSHQTFIGTVTEQVPPGFTVLTADPPAAIEKTDNGTTVTWNRKWEASSPTTLIYTFKTPLTSPLFAQFGPVKALGTATEGHPTSPSGLRGAGEGTSSISSTTEQSISSESTGSSESAAAALHPRRGAADGEEGTSSESAVSSGTSDDSVPALHPGMDSTSSPLAGAAGGEDKTSTEQSSFSSYSSISSVAADQTSSEPAASAPAGSPSKPLRTGIPRSVEEGSPRSAGEESFLSRFLASLFSADVLTQDQVSFTEPTRWQLLSLPSSAQSQDLPAGSLTLTPTGGNSFDANALPSFTLTTEGVTGTDADILDSDGNLQDSKALGKVISVLTSGADIKNEILQAVLREKKTEIAENLSQDSSTVTTIAGGDRRPQDSARTKVEQALGNAEGQAQAAIALQDNPAVSQILDAVVTNDVRNAVAENAVREALGELPQSIIPFLTPPPSTAVDTAATTQSLTTEALMQDIVDVVSGDGEARKDLAEAVASSDERVAGSSQAKPDVDPAIRYPLSAIRSSLIQVKLTNRSGQSFSPAYHFAKGSVVLVLEPMREFEPGMYSLEVQITNPLTQEVSTQTQDFAWGVLAMNPDKDRYMQGESAHIAIGVLDDLGAIVCLPAEAPAGAKAGDAQLRLVIKAPSGEKQELTSKANTIHITDTCGKKDSMMISPDYETSVTFAESGTYLLYLEATTKNGVRGMTQRIVVRHKLEAISNENTASDAYSLSLKAYSSSDKPFDSPIIISRKAATRLYPAGFSPMTITVTFNEDFAGTVTETAPASFVLTKISDGGSVMVSKPVLSADEGSNHNTDDNVALRRTQGDIEQLIQWHGSWTAGQTATFSYLFDAPDHSPDFFLLGPLKFSSATPFQDQ